MLLYIDDGNVKCPLEEKDIRYTKCDECPYKTLTKSMCGRNYVQCDYYSKRDK